MKTQTQSSDRSMNNDTYRTINSIDSIFQRLHNSGLLLTELLKQHFHTLQQPQSHTAVLSALPHTLQQPQSHTAVLTHSQYTTPRAGLPNAHSVHVHSTPHHGGGPTMMANIKNCY